METLQTWSKMYLLVGLGNIGEEYDNTRHNTGFMCADALIKKYNLKNPTTKFNADIHSGFIGNRKVMVVKPLTYMNNSGAAVFRIKSFHKIPLENIYVFHDDLDLPLCKVKYKIGGGDAGHNGLKSISGLIGKNFHRIRVGIGRPEMKDDVTDYVLGKFNSSELKRVREVVENIANSIENIVKIQ
jgi:PTH1 family peptidyl-tRNA hydrolase